MTINPQAVDVDFIPMIVQYCGKPSLHSSKRGWVTDMNQSCVFDSALVLSYCQKTYPELNIVTTRRSNMPFNYTEWCDFGTVAGCVGETVTALPHLCISGNDEVLRPNEDFLIVDADYTDLFELLKKSLAQVGRTSDQMMEMIEQADSTFLLYFDEATSDSLASENRAFNAAKMANIESLALKQQLLNAKLQHPPEDLWVSNPDLVQPLEDALVHDYRDKLRGLYKDSIANHKRLLKTHQQRYRNILSLYEMQAVSQWDSALNRPDVSRKTRGSLHVNQVSRAID
ncbi:hypothetical protein Ciccas_012588 [Cichlidogyrus casuarinus]|uniref:E1 domain-containing protein n=1 Tax=Cichlidogyrus casuarinus TaxID=1844966 RepID=A0ABD2PMX9_9PLAT